MTKKSCIKNKWVSKIKSILAFGILFSIFVSVSSATVEMPNIEQGDGIWGTINVNAPGLVSVNAWSNYGADDISLYIYNQTGNLVASGSGGNGQISIDYTSTSTGNYTFKVILMYASGGGTRTISVSSNKQIILTPKNILSLSNIEQGDGIWGTINVDKSGLVSVNAWSNYGADDILLYIYNQTGNLVASGSGGNGQISLDYIAKSVGNYKFKIILTYASGGGTRKISASSNKRLFSVQKNIRRAFNVAQGQAIYYDLSLKAGELVFLNYWSNYGADDISLYLYNQTGNPVASGFGGNGQISIDYIVPATGTYNVKIVLTYASGGGTRTLSLSTNANFTGITVISPNGGENWTRGTTKTITWTSTGNTGANVLIELVKGGVSSTINSSTQNDGSYNWAIPSNQTPGTDYKVKVTSTTNPAYTDISNNNFTINTSLTGITVTSPNGGEVWQAGTNKTIRWTYSGSPGSYVKIELLKGGVWNRNITLNTRTINGSFNWTIPSNQIAGTNYKVKVTSTTNPAYNDTSNNNFTIIAPCNSSTIYGYSFNDTNGNKTKDIVEVGLLNWAINLKGYDTCTRTLVSKTIKTNATGYFAFKNVNAGTYVLSEDFVLGWLPTTDAAYTLRVPSNSVTIRKDFGNKKFI